MNIEYLVIFTLLLSLLMLMIQRTEAKRRLLVTLMLLIPAILIRNWINYRDLEREGWVALGIALALNFLFWWLIGRYNPVGSSDEIQVLGMDD
ncbi:hypothetical protein HC928_08990 [bacterium]|nr:hypothetical protein [bacterium]